MVIFKLICRENVLQLSIREGLSGSWFKWLITSLDSNSKINSLETLLRPCMYYNNYSFWALHIIREH